MELIPLVKASTPAKADRSATIGSDDSHHQTIGSEHNMRSRRTKMRGAAWRWIFLLLSFGFLLVVAFVWAVQTNTHTRQISNKELLLTTNNHAIPTVAFCGNSMTYYNDLPKLVELMLQSLQTTRTTTVRTTATTTNKQTIQQAVAQQSIQDTCLLGGSNFASLWTEGCHYSTEIPKFGDQGTVQSLLNSPRSFHDCNDDFDDDYDDDYDDYDEEQLYWDDEEQLYWDAVVLQDGVVYASNDLLRNTSIQALREWYLPEIIKASSSQYRYPNSTTTYVSSSKPTKVLLLQTFPAKTVQIRQALLREADFDAFSDTIVEAYEDYANLIRTEFPAVPHTIVPMAIAVKSLYHDPNSDLYNSLHHVDGFHPSPHATYLASCLVVAVLTGLSPPKYDPRLAQQWQQQARFWATTEDENGREQMAPLPDSKDAEELRQLACRVVLDKPCS